MAYRQSCHEVNKIITSARSSYAYNDNVGKVADNFGLLWKTVRRLLLSASDGSWFDGQDTAAVANGVS